MNGPPATTWGVDALKSNGGVLVHFRLVNSARAGVCVMGAALDHSISGTLLTGEHGRGSTGVTMVSSPGGATRFWAIWAQPWHARTFRRTPRNRPNQRELAQCRMGRSSASKVSFDQLVGRARAMQAETPRALAVFRCSRPRISWDAESVARSRAVGVKLSRRDGSPIAGPCNGD
jgi:hypothetical protein